MWPAGEVPVIVAAPPPRHSAKGMMAADAPSSEGRRVDGGSDRLGALIWLWIAAAVVAIGASVLAAPDGAPVVTITGLAGLWVAAVVAGVVHVRVVLRGATEAITLNEVGAIPVILLLPPSLAVLVGATAGLVAEAIITRGQLRKTVFNTAWQVVGLAVASWGFHALSGGAFGAQPRPLVAALVAAGAYVIVNLTAITGLLAVRSRRPWRAVLAEEAASSLLLGYGLAQVGIVAAVMFVEAPWGLPLLALPVLLYRGRARARSEGFAGIAAERDRFERTVDGTSDGVVLLDADGRVEVWNPAMATLSGIEEHAASGRTLDELGWSGLLAVRRSGPDRTADSSRITMDGRALRVSANDTGRGPESRTVLLVHDVSREAELARLQEELVSRVSHEIRTPLTTVMGLLDTLEGHWDELPVDRRRQLVHVASRGGRRLGRLIANLESLARIEARVVDAGSASEQVTRLGLVVDEVARSAERRAAPIVHVDGDLLAQAAPDDVRLILENLLGNAELYGAPPVELAVGPLGDQIVLSVSDHGPGVPDELRSQLFEPFSQGDGGLRRTVQGLGLGLAIVRSLAAASGGSVSHEDVPDGGARFVVRLPAAPHTADPDHQSAGSG